MQYMIQATQEMIDDMVILGANISSLVEDTDKTVVARSAPLMRYGRLGETNSFHQFTYANLTLRQRGNLRVMVFLVMHYIHLRTRFW